MPDIYVDALENKQTLDLICSAAVSGNLEAYAREHDQLCIKQQLREDVGSKAFKPPQDDVPEIGGFFDQTSDLQASYNI